MTSKFKTYPSWWVGRATYDLLLKVASYREWSLHSTWRVISDFDIMMIVSYSFVIIWWCRISSRWRGSMQLLSHILQADTSVKGLEKLRYYITTKPHNASLDWVRLSILMFLMEKVLWKCCFSTSSVSDVSMSNTFCSLNVVPYRWAPRMLSYAQRT